MAASTSLGSSAKKGHGKPILVVGATGEVGRRVVQQLLAQNTPVRALVRNTQKAAQVFDDHAALDIIRADLGEFHKYEKELDAAVSGCRCVVSVSGALRISKLSDFLPWRLLNDRVSDWSDDTTHPYFQNYKAQCYLIDLAKRHDVERFVRLTVISTGFSPFRLISMLFSSILSLSSRYHFLTEQYLMRSGVPYVILRPGGLSNKPRDSAIAHLQVDPSGSVPPPAHVSRDDVAALMVASCFDIPKSENYTLAVRAVGKIKPRPQGTKDDGYATPEECIIEQVINAPGASSMSSKLTMTTNEIEKRSRDYGIAVGLFVYTFSAVSLALGYTATKKFGGLVFGSR